MLRSLLSFIVYAHDLARAPVDIRLREERGQRGHLRVRSGVLHAMRPRALPDSKGVQN
jgi:hypothetical protein